MYNVQRTAKVKTHTRINGVQCEWSTEVLLLAHHFLFVVYNEANMGLWQFRVPGNKYFFNCYKKSGMIRAYGAHTHAFKVRSQILKSDCLLRRVRLHVTTWLPLVGFSWNLVFESFYKICRENSSFVKMDKNKVLHMKTNKHFWLHLANFFLEWKMFQKKKKL